MGKHMKHFQDSYDVIVIGGALAGLASALTLANKGKRVLVLEQHNLPGGVATSFVRGNIEIEATLHEMMSIGPKECPLKIRNFFDEMGVDIEWLRVPDAYRFVDDKTGVNVLVHAGTHGNFETPTKEIADAAGDPDGSLYKKVLDLLNLCHRVYNSVNILSVTHMSKLQMLLKHPDFVKTAGYSAKEVIDTFGLPSKAVDILSAYWIYVGDKLENLPFTVWAVLMADYLGYGSYVPKKFSHEMSLKMAERAMAMGAQVEFGVRVEKILVKNGHVAGVRLADGEEVSAPYVVCSAYPDKAYTQMIEPISAVPEGAIKFVNAKTVGVTCFSVVLLLDSDPESLGIKDYSTFYAPQGMDLNKIFDECATEGPYNYITSICTNLANPDATPKGTCIYSITTLPRPEGWLGVTEENYEEMKRKNAEYFIDMESGRLGVDLRDHILEVVIEAPVTIAHYTGAYRGSVYGYMHTMDDHIVARLQMSEAENYIQGLSFAGAHQISGDGMGPAVTNGRKAAKNVLDAMAASKEAAK
ncbi:MAG: NAD(P)/FAD-dependent oxidoreductase, partial [Anaerolineaceae bacterium]|nr:NAD(P)/FAD-dependent oxidoreductase [Anaerolineaceae bacterium]